MLQAVVVGNVWSTKRIDGLPSGAFLEVEVTGSGERLVAFDVLGSGQGERVLVVQGSVAAGWLPGRPPVDALIVGSIDEPEPAPAAGKAKRTARLPAYRQAAAAVRGLPWHAHTRPRLPGSRGRQRADRGGRARPRD
ncbi:MAG TPA: EutN/CcmL family microcompartment protein, partial [Streptosporangiaceae bacterium]